MKTSKAYLLIGKQPIKNVRNGMLMWTKGTGRWQYSVRVNEKAVLFPTLYQSMGHAKAAMEERVAFIEREHFHIPQGAVQA